MIKENTKYSSENNYEWLTANEAEILLGVKQYIGNQYYGHLRVYKDLNLYKNLDLSWRGSWFNLEGKASGVFVKKNMNVIGTIFSLDHKSDPFLIVLGDLYATNLIIGGSDMYVHGNVIVDNVILTHGINNITVNGEVSAHTHISLLSDYGFESDTKGIIYPHQLSENELQQTFKEELLIRDEEMYEGLHFEQEILFDKIAENPYYNPLKEGIYKRF